MNQLAVRPTWTIPEKLINLSSGWTHYKLVGPEDGELIVCLHGFGLYYGMWDGLTPYLVQLGFKVLCFDFYGAGFSSCPNVAFTLEFFWKQTTELIEKLGYGSEYILFHLIGFSMGGAIASNYAKHNPKKIKSLTLLAPVGMRKYSLPCWGVEYAGELASSVTGHASFSKSIQTMTFLITKTLNILCGINQPPQYQEVLKLMENRTGHFSQILKQLYLTIKSECYFYSINPVYMHSRFKVMRDFPLLKDLTAEIYSYFSSINFPIQVLWGEWDRMLPYDHDLRKKIEKLIPEVRFSLLKNVGHSFVAENADVIRDQILQFLSEQKEIDSKKQFENDKNKEKQTRLDENEKKIDIKIESNFESIQLIEKTNENNITIDNINKENNKQTSSLISYSKEESKKGYIAWFASMTYRPLEVVKNTFVSTLQFPSSLQNKVWSKTQALFLRQNLYFEDN